MKNNKRKVFYEVDPKYFKDGNGTGKGDFRGLYNNMEYVSNLGVDVLIVQNILSSLTEEDSQNFTGISKELGEVNMFKSIVAAAELAKIDVVVEIAIGSIKENHTWFKSAEAQNNSDFTEIIKLYSKRKISDSDDGFKYSSEANSYFSIDEATQEIPLNWKSEQVLNQFKEVIRYWRDLGVVGFVFKDFEFLTDDRREEFMNASTLKELRKLYRGVKEVDDRLYTIGKSIIIDPSEAKKYTDGKTKIFDYFLSENISLYGASKKFGTDALGKFRSYELVSIIKSYAKNKSHILGFGSELTGRVNSRWGNHGEYWAESAKSIALLLMMNPASPMIYFGDEIGTLNIGLTHLDNFMDETIEERKKIVMAAGIKETEFMDAQVMQNPINSKSSLAWSDEEHAGFTWAQEIDRPVPYTYREINVAKQYVDDESVYNFYKSLAKFIKSSKASAIIGGKFSISSVIPGLFRITSRNNGKEIVTYVNLTDKDKKIRKFKEGRVIFSTYPYKRYKEVPRVLAAYESIVVSKDTDEAIKNTQMINVAKLKNQRLAVKQKQANINEKRNKEEQKVQTDLSKIEKARQVKIEAIKVAKANDQRKDAIQKEKNRIEEEKIKKELKEKAREARVAEKTRLFNLKQEKRDNKTKQFELKVKQDDNSAEDKAKEKAMKAAEREKTKQFELKNKEKEDRQALRQKEYEARVKKRAEAKKAAEADKTKQFELKNKEKEDRQALRQKEYEARVKKRAAAAKAAESDKTKQFNLRNKEKEERQAQRQAEFELRQKQREDSKKAREAEKTKQFNLKAKDAEQRIEDKKKDKEDAIKAAAKAKRDNELAQAKAKKATEDAKEAKIRAKIEATKTKEIELKAAEMKEVKAKAEAEKLAKANTKAAEVAQAKADKLQQEQDDAAKARAEEDAKIAKEAEVAKEVRLQQQQDAADSKRIAEQDAKDAATKAKDDLEIQKLKAKADAIELKKKQASDKVQAKEKAKLEKEMKKKMASELKDANKLEKLRAASDAKKAKAKKDKADTKQILETEFTEDDMTSLLESDIAGTTQIDVDDIDDTFIGMSKKKK